MCGQERSCSQKLQREKRLVCRECWAPTSGVFGLFFFFFRFLQSLKHWTTSLKIAVGSSAPTWGKMGWPRLSVPILSGQSLWHPGEGGQSGLSGLGASSGENQLLGRSADLHLGCPGCHSATREYLLYLLWGTVILCSLGMGYLCWTLLLSHVMGPGTLFLTEDYILWRLFCSFDIRL